MIGKRSKRNSALNACTEKGVREGDGVSAILIHTEKGIRFFDEIKDKIVSVQVESACIIRHNPQLNCPSQCDLSEREKMIDVYTKNGYDAIEEYFKGRYGLKRYEMRLSCMLPNSVKKSDKRITAAYFTQSILKVVSICFLYLKVP